MSVYSMTGYASATAGPGNHPEPAASSDVSHARATATSTAAVTIELRSVNGRFLDLSFRLPDELRALEPGLRDLLAASFRRGKIELRLNTKAEADTAWPQPQPEQSADQRREQHEKGVQERAAELYEPERIQKQQQQIKQVEPRGEGERAQSAPPGRRGTSPRRAMRR